MSSKKTCEYATCPSCGLDFAYIGLMFVDCVNSECSHYNSEYAERVLQEQASSCSSSCDDDEDGCCGNEHLSID